MWDKYPKHTDWSVMALHLVYMFKFLAYKVKRSDIRTYFANTDLKSIVNVPMHFTSIQDWKFFVFVQWDALQIVLKVQIWIKWTD